LIAKKSFSPIFQGDEEYGITNLNQLEFNREKEFDPKNTNEKRKTFAFVLAYDGTKYSGFQFQKGQDVKTVEGDLEIAFGRKIMASGRTDKDVSALSQVVSLSTFEDLNEEELLSQIRSSEPFTENRLGVWQCVRVPRRFHPVFCATWRRYLFLFPVNSGPHGEEKIDVDLSFVNRSLAK
jgi:tRNA pseudouridine(38-40) synthase